MDLHVGDPAWHFGGKRLACVSGVLLALVQRTRTLCVNRLAKDRNQAVPGHKQACDRFGRFLANPAVTTHEMLATSRRLSNQCAGGRHVLAIMDTTDLRFPTHEASKRGPRVRLCRPEDRPRPGRQ